MTGNNDDYLRFKRRTEKRLRDLEARGEVIDQVTKELVEEALHYLTDEDIICAQMTLRHLLERLEEA